MKLYKYEDKETTYLEGIRIWFPNKSLPQTITEEALDYLGVTVEEIVNPEPVIHVPTEQELTANKIAEIGSAYEAHINGSFVCSLGYPMQFGELDALKMEGAIILMEVGEQATGYLTDANDETHHNVALADIKAVKIEMLMEFAQAHAKKQLLRQAVKDATSQIELEAIVW